MTPREEQDQTRRRDRYRDGLRAKITALSTALDSLEAGDHESDAAIRRIARQLVGSGANLEMTDITEAATATEAAPQGDLIATTRTLISTLERASRPEAPPAELLLVEDSPVLIQLLTRALSSPACVIHSVKTAAEARAALNTRPFDLVILDLILPDEDGRNLLMFMQDRVATAAVPVLVLSARGGTQTKTECLALGAEQYFEKPFDKVFLSAVANLIQRQRSRAAEATEDLLTGLPNRAEFRVVFDRVMARCRKAQQTTALALLDLDGFEHINETYGYAIGDALLRRMGMFVYGELRHMDVIARWGGDEFAVVFPNQTAERATRTLRRIQDSLRLQEGLPLVDGRRVLVRLSGGVVDVGADESLDAARSRAEQLLYLAKATGRDRILDIVPDTATQARARVLLVESNAQVATLVTDLLGEQGFDVTACDSGEKALELTRSGAFHLVVLDRRLPGTMDGFDFLALLRQEHTYESVPILMLTTMGNEAEIERAFELGADNYIQKPFRHRELVGRMRRLLKRSDFGQTREA
jgi:diguanylate cyclase (GGDEF)-like protein